MNQKNVIKTNNKKNMNMNMKNKAKMKIFRGGDVKNRRRMSRCQPGCTPWGITTLISGIFPFPYVLVPNKLLTVKMCEDSLFFPFTVLAAGNLI